MSPEEMRAFDAKHLWHPYTNVLKPGPTHLVKSAKGIEIELEDGTKLIDAMASWWSAIHGYAQRAMVQALHEQACQLPHIMFGGLTHEPAIELGEKLLAITPPSLNHIFYADSGSVCVEVAMKMAVQYHFSTGNPQKTKFLSLRSGYHGDTWKAMSVCDPVTGMHHLFKGALSVQHFVQSPPISFHENWVDDGDKNGLDELEKYLAENHENLAAFILEPVVQGTGGMIFYHPSYLNKARTLCEQYNVLLIFDEIATGFGRTGKLFATYHTHIEPDILCLGKALTGGMMSFGATMASSRIAEGIGKGSPGLFMHGPTFMGNPLACRVALASLNLLESRNWQGRVKTIEQGLQQGLAMASSLDAVKDIRVLGAIGVIEMKHEISADKAHAYTKELGVWLRPFGHNIYCMPPYICNEEEITKITGAMVTLAQRL